MSEVLSDLRSPTSDLSFWMAGRPRLLLILLKEQLRLSFEHGVVIDSSEASTGVAGHVFKFAFLTDLLPAGGSPFPHFDPFGTELLVSRGGSAIRVTKILLASDAIPGGHAPVSISQCPR